MEILLAANFKIFDMRDLRVCDPYSSTKSVPGAVPDNMTNYRVFDTSN